MAAACVPGGGLARVGRVAVDRARQAVVTQAVGVAGAAAAGQPAKRDGGFVEGRAVGPVRLGRA